jgi:integrase
LGINKVRKANDSGLLGEIVNVAGMHSLRRTAVIEIFENKQDLRLAQAFLGHKNTNYFQLLTR